MTFLMLRDLLNIRSRQKLIYMNCCKLFAGDKNTFVENRFYHGPSRACYVEFEDVNYEIEVGVEDLHRNFGENRAKINDKK